METVFSEDGYSLVLSGGAIRGFAHLGALKAIHEKRVPIKMIAGSSAGAIAGFLYASGNFEKIYEKISRFSLPDLMLIIDLASPSKGLLKGNRIIQKIASLTGKKRLEDLEIPLIVSTTSFYDGNNILFSSGEINKVLKASFSVPGIFPVVQYNEHLLMDGDISNSLPVNAIRGKKIICVDVKSSPLEFRKGNSYEAMMKSFELLGREELKEKLIIAKSKKAIIIQPPLSNIDYISFNHMVDAIKSGYEITIKELTKAGF
jgi:NTE family protein